MRLTIGFGEDGQRRETVVPDIENFDLQSQRDSDFVLASISFGIRRVKQKLEQEERLANIRAGDEGGSGSQ